MGRAKRAPGVPPQRPILAVDIKTDPVLAIGDPQVLFEGFYAILYPTRGYDVAADGQRFVMLQDQEYPRQPVTHINVVLNWFEELKRRVPNN